MGSSPEKSAAGKGDTLGLQLGLSWIQCDDKLFQKGPLCPTAGGQETKVGSGDVCMGRELLRGKRILERDAFRIWRSRRCLLFPHSRAAKPGYQPQTERVQYDGGIPIQRPH